MVHHKIFQFPEYHQDRFLKFLTSNIRKEILKDDLQKISELIKFAVQVQVTNSTVK